MVMDNLKLISAEQEKVTYASKNMKDKLHRTNTAISSNQMWRSANLTPSYIKITIIGHNRHCYDTKKPATTFRIKQELKL
jgi:hypothetical protein